MYLSKHTKRAFVFFVIIINVSCSQKKVFLPRESVYFSTVDTTYSYKNKTYPITITDKPPFEQAVYRDASELLRLMMRIFSFYESEIDKGYFVVFCDDKYIYSGFVRESNNELYAKYNPANEDNQKIYPIIRTKETMKLYYLVARELNKGTTIFIIGDKEGTCIAKSFSGVISDFKYLEKN